MLGAPAPTAVEVREGQELRVDLRFDAGDMRRFAELSGDVNPLHTDDEFARAKGFEGRVVYGALLLAKVSELIGMRLPGRDAIWSRVELEFLNPLYVGQRAVLVARVASHSTSTGLIDLVLGVHTDAKRLAKGRAEVVLAR
jgi:3-hydroxybutyryl-CoA dehydratase